MLKNIFLIICSFLLGIACYAQTGTIRGQIVDDQTGEALIGATALVTGTTTGAATDIDGNFTLANLQPGTYSIQTSYVSYQPQTVQGVVVTAGQVTVLNLRLKPETVGLQEIVVEAQALRNNESALLTIQKRASVVMDGVSAQQIGRSGDSDAAAAIRRVTGVNVEGGRYVYVRGLGDRYSRTALNNAEIPGLDPNRNSIQMDLFPSNLLDNITVYKTFSPELPASFTGGYVNLTTKDFPDRFTFQVSGSLGYNTNATFNNNYLSHQEGKLSLLGFDRGQRAIPGAIENQPLPSPYSSTANNQLIDQVTKGFNREMSTSTKSPFLNHNFSVALGDQREIFGKPLGIIAGLSHQRNFEFYNNGQVGRFVTNGLTGGEAALVTNYDLADTRGAEQVLWGALLNASLKLNNRNKIGLNLMRNQSSEVITRFLEGTYPINSGTFERTELYQTRALQYLERSLSTAQLRGEHGFGGEEPIKFDWMSSFTYLTQAEPDLRFFTNDVSLIDGAPSYQIRPSRYPEPTRYFRDLNEINFDTKVNLTVPFKQWSGLSAKFKTGGAYFLRDREFAERIFQYRNYNTQEITYNGSVEDYLSEGNLGLREGSSNSFNVALQEITERRNSYDGLENVAAGYAMVDLPFTSKLRATIGARYERTDITLESRDPSQTGAALLNNDILPAVNVTYELMKEMNLRLAYGRTLARPVFRELAPYPTFNFIGDQVEIGNPNLKRTLIDNFDLRWEYYPEQGDLLSVSFFYKDFKDPIERAVNPLSVDAIEVNYRNVPQATVYGGEVEIRKNLGFLSEALRSFRVGVNFTLLQSEVDITPQEIQVLQANELYEKSTRPLFGQAPYILNSFVTYGNEASRTTINASFNIAGPRLAIVSTGNTPNVFEQPRGGLDLTITQGFTDRLSARLNAQNLLNPAFRFTQEFMGQEYIYQNYRLGRTFSFGVTYLID